MSDKSIGLALPHSLARVMFNSFRGPCRMYSRLDLAKAWLGQTMLKNANRDFKPLESLQRPRTLYLS
jgi:hypothetical protein